MMEHFLYIASGIWVTLLYTICSLIIGFIWGLILSLLEECPFKFLKKCIRGYLVFFRGTPLLLQLTLVYFVYPSITGHQISAFSAGIIAFSLNSAAYISEILRGGLASVDRAQREAAHTLGIPYFLSMRDIVLPQALRVSAPGLMNESISLLKETALISILGEADIMRRAQLVAAETYSYFEPLFIAAGCYLFLTWSLSKLGPLMERRFFHDNA